MKPVIIFPTYNERDNIAGIVQAVLQLDIPNLGIIIVDDNSPDGTGKIADTLADTHQAVSVIHRTSKEGLGPAYVAGFRQALKDPEVTHIFEMDADFSHQPKYIPSLLAATTTADVALGSRYIPQGGVENWNWLRRFISSFANVIIRLILAVPIHDLTGGFKCFRREVLEQADLDAVASRGYNFQIEMTYMLLRQGFTFSEVPIVFVERQAGESKFSPAIMIESFWQVLKLRFKR